MYKESNKMKHRQSTNTLRTVNKNKIRERNHIQDLQGFVNVCLRPFFKTISDSSTYLEIHYFLLFDRWKRNLELESDTVDLPEYRFTNNTVSSPKNEALNTRSP